MLTAQQKRYRQTPEYKEQQKEYQKRYRQKPEVKEREYQRAKQKWADYVNRFNKTWGAVNRQKKHKPKKEEVHRY